MILRIGTAWNSEKEGYLMTTSSAEAAEEEWEIK